MRWVLAINIYRPRALLLVLLLAAIMASGLLALVGTKPAEAAFPGTNGKIAFASARTTGAGVDNPKGDSEIFTMNPDGTGIEQLTDNTVSDVDPAWSADGGWIAYTSSGSEIYMRSYYDGDDIVFTETRRLTNNTANDTEPTFNRDGTKIAFVSNRDTNSEIYVMDTADSNNDGNGDNQTNLTNHQANDFEPAFSPDGSKIAFTSERSVTPGEVYVMDADGKNQVNLTKHVAYDSEPNWSPDGTKIAFTRNQNGNLEIYMMNATDSSEQKRLTKKAAGDESPAWSPDGKKIAFTSYRGGGDPEIFVMKASRPESKRNRPKNLTKNDVDDFGTNWQPIQ